MCKLPSEVSNFVGREDQLKVCSEILDLESDNTFLIITGGPCYGKSSLAVKVGYKMYDEGYSYVIWINMRDITRNPSSPSLEDIAPNILQKFGIDTSQMEGNMEDYLKRKLEMIVKDSKSALLIFDNADNLIDPKSDASCQSSAYERLWQLIRDLQGSSIRCMFTSRVCKSLPGSKHHKLELGYLSDGESHCFLNKELQDLYFQDKDALIQDFLAIGYGLPYALKLMCSEVVTMDSEEMIVDYVNELKESPLEALDDEARMTNLFDLSYKRLTPDERCVFTSLAVFPSSFSYSYLSKVLKNLEGNLKSTVLNKLKKHSLVSFDSELYMIHPFLRQFLKKKHWDNDSREKYEIAYFTAYIRQLFDLAKGSLEKDKFSKCLEEFRREQQNFLHVMVEISKGWANSPHHLQQLVRENLLKLHTPQYIYVVLFLCHEIYDRYSAALIEFFKGCETFVEGQMKKNIWCCRSDVFTTIYEEKIGDDYKDIEADAVGKILVANRKCNKIVDKVESKTAVSRLDNDMKWVEKLEDCKMKAYFVSSMLKTKVRLLKKAHFGRSEDDKNCLIGYLKKALDECESTFGEHWLTIDCHTQLGKLYWAFDKRDDAITSFNSAVSLAEHLSVTGNRRYLSCLMDKGRFLVDADDEESIEAGKRLVDEALESCKEFPDEIMWLLAMKTLVKVDKARREEMVNMFLEKDKCNYRWIEVMVSVINAELGSPDKDVKQERLSCDEAIKLERLERMIEHMKYLCKMQEDKELGQLIKKNKRLFSRVSNKLKTIRKKGSKK